ncbi:MAG: hypothetical protein LBR17_01350 [Bacteroidales bacterium]|jgi:hypothetical protein|nr:hypothetical protein [Bacteroidales bacterium]
MENQQTQRKINRFLPLTIVILLSLVFIFTFYNKIALSPNTYLLSKYGDGLKNYYVLANQIKESSYTQAESLNYPYGENFLFLDCQPALSMVGKFLSQYFPSIEGYAVGITNFLMIFSLVFCAVLLFRILEMLNVNSYYAALCGFAIALLSPQVFRLSGHWALAYSFVIPLAWYLLIKFSKSKNKKLSYSFWLALCNFVFFMLHAYLGMMCVCFILFFFVFDFMLNAKRYKGLWLNHIGYFLIQILLPVITFYFFTVLTDHHTGRLLNPAPLFQASATFNSVFLPTTRPLSVVLLKYFPAYTGWEGNAYIGIFSDLILIYCIIRLCIRRKFMSKFWKTNSELHSSFWASVIVLILSMEYHFKWGLACLFDYVPLSLKYFRSIGRFAWVFYYVATTFCVAWIWYAFRNLWQNQTKSVITRCLMFVLLIFLPVSYFLEGLGQNIIIKKNFSYALNYFNEKSLPDIYRQALQVIEPDKYQAILPLPFYHWAGETYDKQATEQSALTSMTISYWTRLPMLSHWGARVSLWENRNGMQLTAPSFYSKLLANDIKDQRPFLITYTGEDLNEGEQEFLNKAKLIFTSNEFSLYEIERNILFENTAEKEIAIFNSLDNLVERDGFLCSDSTSKFFFFDSIASFNKDGFHKIGEIAAGILDPEKEYVASVWFSNKWDNFGEGYLQGSLFAENVDENGANIDWASLIGADKSPVIVGDWTLETLFFKAENPDKKVQITFEGWDYPKNSIMYPKNLLIYEKGMTVYKVLERNNNEVTKLFKNNHVIQK